MTDGSLLALRLFNVLLGTVTLILIYLSLELVFPAKPLLTVGAVAFAAFLPMHVAMTAAVNNDGLAELLLAAALLTLLRWLRIQFASPLTASRHGIPCCCCWASCWGWAWRPNLCLPGPGVMRRRGVVCHLVAAPALAVTGGANAYAILAELLARDAAGVLGRAAGGPVGAAAVAAQRAAIRRVGHLGLAVA